MAESSISVAVRIRPFSAKEAAQLAPQETAVPFLGDGGLSGSPAKLPGSTATSSSTGSSLSSLRTKFLRPIIQPVDDKVLIFDPPDTNPLSRLYSAAAGVSGSSSASGGPPSNHFGHGSRRNRDVRYAFDRVFDEHCGQDVVFENTIKPLLDGILNGFNASVFAYGATGCGKTHTISGTPEDPGVIFLTMKELYQRIDDCREESEVNVRLSYLEIYNETIRDLLSPEPTPPGQGLLLREDAANKISVMGITEHVPESPESVLRMIQEGNERRTMSPTEANAVSSRSHAVLQINVTQRPRAGGIVDETTSASLNIIDLAGSERASATRNNGARMKEGANINKSLLALGNCINALCSTAGQKGKHVPYRNSKLTRLLKFSLGGNCKTVMIVCVSPSSAHYEETHNTLKYANQAKNIRTKVSRNMLNVDRHVGQYVQTIHELNEQLKELKAQLAEQRSVETAAEKRRKAEIAREMSEAKANMRSSTESVKVKIEEHATAEALIEAAKLRSKALQARLEEVSTELASLASQSVAPPVDLVSEREMLLHLVAAEEAIASDASLGRSVEHLSNCLQMQRGVVFAAAHNNKFDEAASELVRGFGQALLAEVEACRLNRTMAAFKEALERSAKSQTALLMIANRCTVAMKEAADEMEWKAADERGQGDEGEAEATNHLLDLASRLRNVSASNDEVLSSAFGKVTTVASSGVTGAAPLRLKGGASRSSALRKPRNSLLSSSAAVSNATTSATSAAPAPPRAALAAASRANRRLSVAAASSMSHHRSAASPKGKAHLRSGLGAPMAKAHAFMSPRAPRRGSLGGAARRKSVVLLAATSKGARLVKEPATAAKDKVAKKAFRWADEAGEGAIDDAGLARPHVTMANDESMEDLTPVEIDVDPATTVPSKAQRVPITLQTGGEASFPPSDDVVDEDGMGVGGSAEWEDLGGGGTSSNAPPISRPGVAARVRGRDSLSRGPKMGSTSSTRRRASAATASSVPKVGGAGAGVFDRNFLSKRAAAAAVAAAAGRSGATEGDNDDDVSSSLLGVAMGVMGSSPTPAKGEPSLLGSVPTKPHVSVGTTSRTTPSSSTPFLTVPSSVNDENHDVASHAAAPPVRPGPYNKRRESAIGPVRRRGRSSLAESTNEVSNAVTFPSTSSAPSTGHAPTKKLSVGSSSANPFEGRASTTTAPSPKTGAGFSSLNVPPVPVRVSLRSSTGPPVSNAAFASAAAASASASASSTGQTSPRKTSGGSRASTNGGGAGAGAARRTSSFSSRQHPSSLNLALSSNNAGTSAAAEGGNANPAKPLAVWR